jgi:hypothetical protein
MRLYLEVALDADLRVSGVVPISWPAAKYFQSIPITPPCLNGADASTIHVLTEICRESVRGRYV